MSQRTQSEANGPVAAPSRQRADDARDGWFVDFARQVEHAVRGARKGGSVITSSAAGAASSVADAASRLFGAKLSAEERTKIEGQVRELLQSLKNKLEAAEDALVHDAELWSLIARLHALRGVGRSQPSASAPQSETPIAPAAALSSRPPVVVDAQVEPVPTPTAPAAVADAEASEALPDKVAKGPSDDES